MFATKSLMTSALVATLTFLPMAASAQSASAIGQASGAAAATVPGVSARGATAVVQELQAQGFEVVDTGRTLLGRVRIDAVAEGLVREVVLHQSTGEILSDVVRRVSAGATAGVTGGVGTTGGVGANINAGASANVGLDLGGGGVSVGGGAGVGLGIGN